ncbi:leucine-rich repeat protein [Velocimicrobium porci]|uniref:Leucine-rich repeat protein n=1 Tax=Velocimicrobium porci TaxID=2606634 RepID=A0A6L5XW46_9FIRM|nr:leucine-rich repeat protein [Velocimicrobium porci]MSS62829.1 leucine-rich repeat protein [Velocimicrobium porci]
MKKSVKTKLALLLTLILTVPAIAKADWGGWYDGNTSNTWYGDDAYQGKITADGIGRYEYRPENDSFYCFLESSSSQKSQDFVIIEDSILGKPVTELLYIMMDDDPFYTVSSKGFYVPDSVTDLDLFVFWDADFQNVYLSKALTKIPKCAFTGCKNVKQLQLPDKLKKINEEAFSYCTNLKQIKIPEKVTIIEKKAFENCKNLTKIYLPASVKTIEKNVFTSCDKLTIYCEKDSYAYKYAKKNKIKTKLLSNKTVKATQITNLPKSITVGTHESYLLFPFIEPFYATNQKLAYISDDPSIAEVNQNGKVEGKKKGTTTITVMTTDGSHLQEKVKVTVNQGKTSINPYFSLYQLLKGTTEFNVDAMLYNRNEKATYQIESSDSSIATAKIENGTLKVTAKKQGNAVFVVTEKKGKTKNEIGSFPISVDTNKKF